MTRLAMHDNLLAVYPEILKRLEMVKEIKAIKEVGDLAELMASRAKEGGKAKIAPFDGAVYVVYGGDEVSDQAHKGKQIKHTLYFYLCFMPLLSRSSAQHLARSGGGFDGNSGCFGRLGRRQRICQ